MLSVCVRFSFSLFTWIKLLLCFHTLVVVHRWSLQLDGIRTSHRHTVISVCTHAAESPENEWMDDKERERMREPDYVSSESRVAFESLACMRFVRLLDTDENKTIHFVCSLHSHTHSVCNLNQLFGIQYSFGCRFVQTSTDFTLRRFVEHTQFN